MGWAYGQLLYLPACHNEPTNLSLKDDAYSGLTAKKDPKKN